jgi:transposase
VIFSGYGAYLKIWGGIGVREVNPVKTNRQKDFYGQDKSDEISARCIAAIVLRSLPIIRRTGNLLKTIRELSRERKRLVKTQTQQINRLHSHLIQVYLGVLRGTLSFPERQKG